MSEGEKFEAQGRAHAGLREAKSSAATLKASLLAYNKRLEETSAFLKTFLADPLAEGLSLPRVEVVKQSFRNLNSSTFERDVDQLVAEMRRVRDLQEQIDNF